MGAPRTQSKSCVDGTSLAVQWLTVFFPCRGDGLILGQEDKNLHALKCRKKKKKKKLCRQLKLHALGSDILYSILVH